jgi:hypothetical protein
LQNFENIFKKFENPCINQMITLSVVNDRNQNFGRYQNFGNFGIGKEPTDTDTERDCIPKPIPKPIPKDEKFI